MVFFVLVNKEIRRLNISKDNIGFVNKIAVSPGGRVSSSPFKSEDTEPNCKIALATKDKVYHHHVIIQ